MTSSREDLTFHPVLHAGLLKFRVHVWGILQLHHQLMVEHLSKSPEPDASQDVKMREMARLIEEITLQLRVVDSALGLGKPKTELQ